MRMFISLLSYCFTLLSLVLLFSSCSTTKMEQKDSLEFTLNQSLKLIDSIEGGYSFFSKNIYACRILDVRKKSVTFSYSSCYHNIDIVNSLTPFYYYESNYGIFIFPLIHESSQIFKNILPVMDSAFPENNNGKKLYESYSSNSPVMCTPSIGFCNIKMVSSLNITKIRYFTSSPLAAVPLEYRPILDYKPSYSFRIDSTLRWYPYQTKDAFKDDKKLKNSMFKKEVKI